MRGQLAQRLAVAAQAVGLGSHPDQEQFSRCAPAPARHDDLNLERAEKQMVEEALRKHSYNISLAAAELGLTRASLYRRMEKHGL